MPTRSLLRAPGRGGVDTLAVYVKALGGKLKVVADFGVGGKAKGNPVINVSIIATGLGGQDVAVDWYYL